MATYLSSVLARSDVPTSLIPRTRVIRSIRGAVGQSERPARGRSGTSTEILFPRVHFSTHVMGLVVWSCQMEMFLSLVETKLSRNLGDKESKWWAGFAGILI